MVQGLMAAAAVGVILATTGCVTGRDSVGWGPMHQPESVSSRSSAADDFIAREAAQMMGEDQRRAATATENAEPVVPYRDSPLGPLRRR